MRTTCAIALLVLLLWVFYGLPVVIGLQLSAFEADIFRAGIQSVPQGQVEAAKSLGLSWALQMRLVCCRGTPKSGLACDLSPGFMTCTWNPACARFLSMPSPPSATQRMSLPNGLKSSAVWTSWLRAASTLFVDARAGPGGLRVAGFPAAGA